MQYECSQCGQLGRFHAESVPFSSYCPECEEETAWTRAFEAEGGISF